MIKQTVNYGVWTLNRHDDNKIEVLKNGQVCEKASPAYREIAAEIGFEIDPEWRTSQLGRNVFKAVENATNSSCSSTTASTPVEEKKTSATEQDPTPKKTISEDKNTQPIQEVSQNETISVFDVILQSKGENALQVVKAVKEQLDLGLKEAKDLVDVAPSTIAKGIDRSTAEKLKLELELAGAKVEICSKTQAPTTNASQKKYDVNSIENSEDYARGSVIQAFYKEWRKYTKAQFEALLSKAEEGDAITQYECGYIFAELSRFQLFVKRLDNEDSVALEHYSKITDVSKASNLADDWLTKSAEQGFGLAMWNLGEHFATQGSIAQFLDAVRWKDRCKEVNPWRSNFGLYATLWDKIENSKRYTKLYHEYEQLISENENAKRYTELSHEYEKLKSENEELKSEKEKYERWWREDYNKAKALEQELERYKSQSSSSSTSSSRSSRDENVQVCIKYTTDSNMWHLIHGSGGVVTMTRAEYKKLMNDSLKGRTAFVRAKFGISSSFKITGVDISLV